MRRIAYKMFSVSLLNLDVLGWCGKVGSKPHDLQRGRRICNFSRAHVLGSCSKLLIIIGAGKET